MNIDIPQVVTIPVTDIKGFYIDLTLHGSRALADYLNAMWH